MVLGRVVGVHSRNDKVVVHNHSEALHGMANSSDAHSEVEHSGVGHSHSGAVYGGHSVANDRNAFYELPVYSRYSLAAARSLEHEVD